MLVASMGDVIPLQPRRDAARSHPALFMSPRSVRRAAPEPAAPSSPPLEAALIQLHAGLDARVRDLESRTDARIRELEARVRELELRERAPAVPAPTPNAPPAARSAAEHEQAEKQRMLEALNETGWNKLRAAEKVGLPRRTFYRRMKEYGIQ
jgi:hypothetical protein